MSLHIYYKVSEYLMTYVNYLPRNSSRTKLLVAVLSNSYSKTPVNTTSIQQHPSQRGTNPSHFLSLTPLQGPNQLPDPPSDLLPLIKTLHQLRPVLKLLRPRQKVARSLLQRLILVRSTNQFPLSPLDLLAHFGTSR